MKTVLLLIGLAALSGIGLAQPEIPVGTILPISLETSLDSHESKLGQAVVAKIAQDVPLTNGSRLKAGTRVTGEVIAASPAKSAQPGSITLRFQKIDLHGHPITISTNLRAIASRLEVEAAQSQRSGFEKGAQPPWSQNTVQIGGDAVYRETGLVERRGQKVGESVYAGDWGIVARVDSGPGTECPESVAGNDRPQALWVFSHDACGVFGLEAVIKDAGGDTAEGQFVLESTKGDLRIRAGSALLLRVNSAAPSSSGQAFTR